MKVVFTVYYHTNWGERLFIVVSSNDKDASSLRKMKHSGEMPALEMNYHNEEAWQLEMTLPDSTGEIYYYYFVEDENGVRKQEVGDLPHHTLFDQHCNVYFLYDDWQTKLVDKIFYTSAFTKNLFARPVFENGFHYSKNLIFRVCIPITTSDQTVVLTGNQACLGNWNPSQAPLLSAVNFPHWEIRLNASDILFPLEYKYVVLDSSTNQICYWEKGKNRVIHQPPCTGSRLQVTGYNFQMDNNACITVDNFQFRTPVLSWKTTGTVIPVFSLRSEQSFGIGDIGDLKKLIDWAMITGQHVIQVLPMNDTTRTHTWKDSYPYSAISIYALHPLYINIAMMGEIKDKKKAASYRKNQKRLNKKETVDYQSAEKHKTAYYRDYFEEEKDNILKNKDFQAFIVNNKEWLIPYAAFSCLRDKYHTADFTKWEDDSRYNPEKWQHYFTSSQLEEAEEASFLFFLQYTLHNQMAAISCYARENRVILKGDLPIGVNRESVEAWTTPDCFNMQTQAGAPPDFFSEKGQNWSFPTYNWDAMSRDGFDWWKKRFQNLRQYFDSFRIDHILGFFRIWEIPIDYTEGLCGYFNPALPLPENEIEQYGLIFNEQWLTPCIHIKYLPELFGDNKIQDLSPYLNPCYTDHFALNENFASQRKINHFFDLKKDKRSQIIKNGLMHITNEVLFIRDPYLPDGFHPRISASQSFRYRELPIEDRNAFDKIYHHFFFERHNEFWKQTAMNRLEPLLKNVEMLVCGEDLGMIPAVVHEVMDDLQICSLELERLSKDANYEFTDLTKLPALSICTTSTHDMNPIRAWWSEDREKTQHYYNHVLRREGIAPDTCTADIAEQIINSHINASSIITIIPLQDWFAMYDDFRRPDCGAERINDPANPSHYWRYRMHITIETLLQSAGFNGKIQKITSCLRSQG